MSVAARKPKHKATADPTVWPLALRTEPVLDVSEDQFYEFCRLNGDLRIERTAAGEWLVMPPTEGDTGSRNANLTWQLVGWAKQDGTGVAYDSSTGFGLPNGAMRAPDGAWLLKDRVSPDVSRGTATVHAGAPRLRPGSSWSPSDWLSDVQDKMTEYLANGARLGWLLYPPECTVYLNYRPDAPLSAWTAPSPASGQPVLPGSRSTCERSGKACHR